MGFGGQNKLESIAAGGSFDSTAVGPLQTHRLFWWFNQDSNRLYRSKVRRWEDFPRGVSPEILVDGRYRPPSTHGTCPHPAGWDGTDGDMEQGQARIRAEIHRWHGGGA